MARRCPDCNLDLERFANPKTGAHRCLKPSEKRAPYTAQPAQTAVSNVSPLAPKLPPLRHTPSVCACRADEVLAAITNLTAQFEALRAALSQDKPRTDA